MKSRLTSLVLSALIAAPALAQQCGCPSAPAPTRPLTFVMGNTPPMLLHWQKAYEGRWNLICDQGTHRKQVVAYMIQDGTTKNWHVGALAANIDLVGEYETEEAALHAVVRASWDVCEGRQ